MRFGIRELLFLLVIVAVPVLAHFTVYRPLDRHTVTLDEDTAAKEKRLRDVSDAEAELENMTAEITLLNERLTEFEAQLPSQSETEDILREVDLIVRNGQLRTRSFKPDKPVRAAQHFELPINLIIEGDFDAFYSFIKQVEELPRITRMPDLKITKQPKDGEGFVRVEMTLSIFYEDDRAAPRA